MKTNDWDYPTGKRGFNRIAIRNPKDTENNYLIGCVATPFGFVECYSQGGTKTNHYTRLDFIINGVVYVRSFKDKRFTKRGIKTKAFEFAKELMDKKEKGFVITEHKAEVDCGELA